jgi:hypothetical protein
MKYLCVLAVVACGDNRPPPPDAALPVEVVAMPATQNRKLDLLFVIDDSPNTLELQNAFKLAFPMLEAQLEIQGRPDLHIGATDGDLGTLAANGVVAPGIGAGPGSCHDLGTQGALRTFNAPIDGTFIADDGNGATNYTGSLASVVSAILSFGSYGCAFQQHLAAARMVFTNPANAGFRRADAALGVIVLADDDECSVLDPAVFDLENDLGFGTYRCYANGITCDPDDTITPGPRTNCRPRADSRYIADPAPFRDDLRTLASDPRRVAFGAAAGDPSPYEVVSLAPPGGGVPSPREKAACAPSDGVAPAVRLAWLAGAFGDRGTFASLCNPVLDDAAHRLGVGLRRAMGDPCIEDILPDGSTCTATDVIGDGPELPLPHCDVAATTDCWELVTDEAVCPNAAHRELVVRRSHPPLEGTYTLLRCTMLSS